MGNDPADVPGSEPPPAPPDAAPPVMVRPPPLASRPPVVAAPVAPAKPAEKGRLAGLGVVGALLLKFGAKLKFLAPALKFIFPVLKTGGSMLLTIWLYGMAWGWPFAVGFVLLIFVHECGHLIAARQCGLKVGAPVFIPFMGALIALKEAPKNAWIEAKIGYGGPLLGGLASLACYPVYLLTGNPIWSALSYTGCFLNLFNLAPIGFLDGGRIVSALSPWLWVIGYVVMGGLLWLQFNFIVLLILLVSLPRLVSLFRKKSDIEKRYFEVTPQQRLMVAVLYFGLIAVLVAGMLFTHVEVQR